MKYEERVKLNPERKISLQKPRVIRIKLLLTNYYLHFSLVILTLKNLNAIFYNCFNNSPIFASRNLYFYYNAMIQGIKYFINI